MVHYSCDTRFEARDCFSKQKRRAVLPLPPQWEKKNIQKSIYFVSVKRKIAVNIHPGHLFMKEVQQAYTKQYQGGQEAITGHIQRFQDPLGRTSELNLQEMLLAKKRKVFMPVMWDHAEGEVNVSNALIFPDPKTSRMPTSS